jgi:hypothetical protein
MSASTKLVDKLEGVENFHAWKYRIKIILEKNDLARFVKEEVPESADATDKALLSRDEDQALATHSKGRRNKSYFQKEIAKESHPKNKFIHKESQPKRFQKKGQRKERDFSSYQCYHCEKMGHIARHCPDRRVDYKMKNKRHHAHAVEDEEPPTKIIKE